MTPDFSRSEAEIKPLTETVALSVAGTALAMPLVRPLTFLEAHNAARQHFIGHAQY